MRKNKLHLVLVNVWPFMIKTPHFGLTCLAAFIKEKLPEVKISIVEGVDPIKEILVKEPDLIGITSDTIAFTRTLKLVKKIKSKFDSPIIIGGVHITALPETLNPAFQLGVIGEGEITLLELLKVFKKYRGFPKRAIAEIKGIVFRDKKRLITTGKREPISDIDSLPYPARDLTPMEELYLKDQLNLFGVRRLATMMTSRGCPYGCVFCGSPVQWPGVRFHSPEYVVKEMKFLLKKYRIDGVMFWDDLFITPEARLVKLVKLIKKEGLHKKLTFFGYARANLINEKVCRILQEINTKRLIFGLESGSEKILGYLKKHSVTIADNQRAVKLCRKYGITTSSGFIVGTPGEKIKDLKKTYQFIKKYPLDNMHIFFLTPYPGTEIWNIAQKKGLVSEEMDFGSLFVQSPPLSFFDFFRKSKPEMIEGRVFLNQEYSQDKQYLDLIFKMQKLVYWQNLFFYLKTVPKDLRLIKMVLKLKIKRHG